MLWYRRIVNRQGGFEFEFEFEIVDRCSQASTAHCGPLPNWMTHHYDVYISMAYNKGIAPMSAANRKLDAMTLHAPQCGVCVHP